MQAFLRIKVAVPELMDPDVAPELEAAYGSAGAFAQSRSLIPEHNDGSAAEPTDVLGP